MASAVRARSHLFVRNSLLNSRRLEASHQPCRAASYFGYRHENYAGKVKVPTHDEKGNLIARSPNGYVTDFELWREGVLKDQLREYKWSQCTPSYWRNCWKVGFVVGVLTVFLGYGFGEHIVFDSDLVRKRRRAELEEARRAREQEQATLD